MSKPEEKNRMVMDALKSVDMHSAGEKMKEHKMVSPSMNEMVHYPTLWLNASQVPELKGCDVEEEVTFVVKGVITSHSLNESPKNKRETFDIQIKKIGVIDKKYPKNEGKSEGY